MMVIVRKMLPLWLVPISVLLLAACGGGGGGGNDNDSDQLAAPKVTTKVPVAPVTLTGRATYTYYSVEPTIGIDYDRPVELPVRGAVVELHSADGVVIDRANTSNDGLYQFQVTGQSDVEVVVKAALGAPRNPDTKVVDNTSQQALYSLIMPVRVGEVDLRQDFNADSGWDGQSYSGTRAAAPFAILDTIYKAQQLVRSADSNVIFPDLLVNWSERNIPTKKNPTKNIPTSDLVSIGEIGITHFSSDNQIYILGAAGIDTDEYDAHVIAHEWAHYLERVFSRSDSLGGHHQLDDILDPSVAFSEGFGNAFSAMVLDDPIYVDAIGQHQAGLAITMDIEEDSTLDSETNDLNLIIDGFYSEASVQEFLYDLYDRSEDESLQLGFTPIYEALAGRHKTTPAFTSMYSFLDALLAQDNIDGAAVSQLAADENITRGDEYEAISHRIYTTLSTEGTILNQDVDGDPLRTWEDFGDIDKLGGNKLYNRMFFRYVATTTGCFTIRVQSAFNSDVLIYVPGRFNAISRRSGSEVYTGVNLGVNEAGSIAVGSKNNPIAFSIQMSLTPGECNG